MWTRTFTLDRLCLLTTFLNWYNEMWLLSNNNSKKARKSQFLICEGCFVCKVFGKGNKTRSKLTSARLSKLVKSGRSLVWSTTRVVTSPVDSPFPFAFSPFSFLFYYVYFGKFFEWASIRAALSIITQNYVELSNLGGNPWIWILNC